MPIGKWHFVLNQAISIYFDVCYSNNKTITDTNHVTSILNVGKFVVRYQFNKFIRNSTILDRLDLFDVLETLIFMYYVQYISNNDGYLLCLWQTHIFMNSKRCTALNLEWNTVMMNHLLFVPLNPMIKIPLDDWISIKRSPI